MERDIEQIEEQQQKKQKLVFNLVEGGTVPLKPIKSSKSVGRNDPCTCGSGKKFKKCCGA